MELLAVHLSLLLLLMPSYDAQNATDLTGIPNSPTAFLAGTTPSITSGNPDTSSSTSPAVDGTTSGIPNRTTAADPSPDNAQITAISTGITNSLTAVTKKAESSQSPDASSTTSSADGNEYSISNQTTATATGQEKGTTLSHASGNLNTSNTTAADGTKSDTLNNTTTNATSSAQIKITTPSEITNSPTATNSTGITSNQTGTGTPTSRRGCADPPALCCPGQNNSCYRGCYCDEICLKLRDCCDDYISTCPQPSSSPNASSSSPPVAVSTMAPSMPSYPTTSDQVSSTGSAIPVILQLKAAFLTQKEEKEDAILEAFRKYLSQVLHEQNCKDCTLRVRLISLT